MMQQIATECSRAAAGWVRKEKSPAASWLTHHDPIPVYLEHPVSDVARCLALVEPQPDASGQSKFDDLAATWKSDTQFTSSSTDLILHASYQRIIGMGSKALPLVLASLEKETDHWGWALRAITGIDPVPADAVGDIELTARAWLDWGRSSGIAW